MTAETVSSGVRAVLDSPRGRRFSRPGASAPPTSPTREQRLLTQMEGNPRVAYRQAHGELPPWMHVHAARLAERDTPTPEGPKRPRKPATTPIRPRPPAIPRPRSAPDDGTPPPRPKIPPLPRRRSRKPHNQHPHNQRPHGHRKPRRLGRNTAWHLLGYTLAALTGVFVHHLTAGLP
ncbi:hypothetical protein [Nocardiopsis synnemataformans]|uniref:hypothetical protein n=1 Tax=Nocardiopsis synnemataformans TaxID=61305 RepID=UPI003EB79FFE